MITDRQLTSQEVCEMAGITYRQLDHWVRAGYLEPLGGVGSGTIREWTPEQQALVVQMARLVRGGFTVFAARQVAERILAGESVSL